MEAEAEQKTQEPAMDNLTEEEKQLLEEDRVILERLFGMVNSLIDMALQRFTDKVNEELGTKMNQDEALTLLENNPQLLNPDILDEAINYNAKIAIMINLAVSLAGSLLRRNEEWYKEMRENGGKIVILLMQRYRPDLWKLLENKPNVTAFLINYILGKLGLL